jgi:arylsulfatase A-like enzyme
VPRLKQRIGMLAPTAALLLLLLPIGAVAAAAVTPPHIVHIMADDTGVSAHRRLTVPRCLSACLCCARRLLGPPDHPSPQWNDLGYKNSMQRSPILDKLATEGMQLTSHYAFKVCSPTRSSFHTGRYPFSMGLYDNSPRAVPFLRPKITDGKDPEIASPMAVPVGYKLLPELLAAKGYRRHAVGKWHLGYAYRKYTPTYRGYESFLGYYNAMTNDHWTHAATVCAGVTYPDMCLSNGTNLRALGDNGTYEATLFGSRSVDLIEAHDTTTPFFLYLAFHNEHDPHQAPLESVQSFPHIVDDTYKVTAAMIETMDVQIGRVVAALNSTGMVSLPRPAHAHA